MVAIASSIIWHELLKESYWLRFLRYELVKRNVVSLFVIHMARSQYCLHQPPIPAGLVDILAPVLFNGVVGSTKVITWNSRRNMVRDMYIYVMAKDLYPSRIATVNCAV